MQNETLPSDTASLPPPPFLVWVIVVVVITCVVYAGYYVVWVTLIGSPSTSGLLRLVGQLSTTTSSAGSKTIYNEISSVITPHPLSILVLLLLVAGYPLYAPYVWATIQWAWLTVTGKRLPDRATNEGFLVSPPGDPGVTTWMIQRRDLLDRLRRRVFQLNPPHGIRCGTSTRKDAPYWEPSSKLIHLYVKRVERMYPVTADPDPVNPDPATKTAIKEMRLLCEERAILKEVITQMEIDPDNRYSYRQAREHLQPLLAFYKRTRTTHPRRVVDDILGLPLGQRDPFNEAEDTIVNAHRHILPTQTNKIHQLDAMSNGTSSRALRGGNDAKPIAPHLQLDS